MSWQPAGDLRFWTDKQVLVTGHTGFKGSWLSLWLSELGANVTGASLRPDTTPNLFDQLQLERRLTKHIITDIRNPAALKELVLGSQPDIVFHLAAQPLVLRSYCDPISTWQINVQGTLNLLEALREVSHPCSAIMVTTDKVYQNNEWCHGYRESDPLGGNDPYSASKAAAEIAIASWRHSFCGTSSGQTPYLSIATARAGNVIGGGDWSENRIIPDVMRALAAGKPVYLRHPHATRPWQHVLEPLSGYIRLAERLYTNCGEEISQQDQHLLRSAFNFGPYVESNRSVADLVTEALAYWPGKWVDTSDPRRPHEAKYLHLQIDKAFHILDWHPRWPFSTTVKKTVEWYKQVSSSPHRAEECCLADLHAYLSSTSSK